MTAPVPAVPSPQGLPGLIDQAASVLANARDAAEVLEARDLAAFAYDISKRAARLAKAKQAHDDLIVAAHRAQAHALEIESEAKHRLADEYDAAQERGEVQRPGGNRTSNVPDQNNAPSVSDLGLSRKEIHDARLIRDAEVADPGIVRRTLDERLERGEEPTRASLRRAAEAKLERSIGRFRHVEENVRQLEANKPPPLTPQQRERQVAIFGTQEDRAICGRIEEIVELIDEQPEPGEAVRRVPPASRHAIDTASYRRAASWLINFSNIYEQEASNG